VENGMLPMHLYGQPSIETYFVVHPRFISSHMLSKTNSFIGSSGWAILVCSHFSFPHINIDLNFNPFLNMNWTMGNKLCWVVDDHIPKSNFKEHNCKNSNKFNWTLGLQAYSNFPHYTRLFNNFHSFTTLICPSSHNNPLKFRTTRYFILTIKRLLGSKMGAPTNKS